MPQPTLKATAMRLSQNLGLILSKAKASSGSVNRLISMAEGFLFVFNGPQNKSGTSNIN